MERRQLEMRLDCALERRSPMRPHRRRPTRARWWFDQMRRAVDQASDWQPSSESRLEVSVPQHSHGT